MTSKLRFRSQESCEMVFASMIDHYVNLVRAGMDHDKAAKMTINLYSDFTEWVYYRGSFANDN